MPVARVVISRRTGLRVAHFYSHDSQNHPNHPQRPNINHFHPTTCQSKSALKTRDLFKSYSQFAANCELSAPAPLRYARADANRRFPFRSAARTHRAAARRAPRRFAPAGFTSKRPEKSSIASFPICSEFLQPGDVLVLNNSRVIPARLHGTNAKTGGQFEILLLEENAANDWWAMMRPGKRARSGRKSNCKIKTARPTKIVATVTAVNDEGHRRLRFSGTENLFHELEQLGEMPLPPYIERHGELPEDRERYQTVFAQPAGSVAAPTAGLHFTPELLEKIRARGVKICFVTLHVGAGTFLPVKTENVAEHKMHAERFEVGEETVSAVNAAKKSGHRVIAVGTTAARTLETVARQNAGKLNVYEGKTDIFIFPPARVSNRGCAADELSSAGIHAADAGQRVRRAGRKIARTRPDFVRLRRSDPRALPLLQLRRCDADFMNPKSKIQSPKLPFVFVNMAMTADGKIATANRAVHSFGSRARSGASLRTARHGGRGDVRRANGGNFTGPFWATAAKNSGSGG